MRTTQTWTMRLIAGIVTGALLSASPARADGHDERRERQAIQALMSQQDALVAVTLVNGRTQEGRLERLGARSFLLVDETGQMTQIPYGQVTRARRLSPREILTIVGLAAGVALVVWCAKVVGNALCLPGQE